MNHLIKVIIFPKLIYNSIIQGSRNFLGGAGKSQKHIKAETKIEVLTVLVVVCPRWDMETQVAGVEY